MTFAITAFDYGFSADLYTTSSPATVLALPSSYFFGAGSQSEATAVTEDFTFSSGSAERYWANIVVNVEPAATSPSITAQRKGSTFDVTHGLGTITTATLNGNAVTVNTTGAGTVNLTDSSGIATSGEYDLVLGDGTGTETYTVQLNVIGLPSFNINKDGADQASLADVEFIALSGAAGSRAVVDQVSDITTDVNGDTGPIEFTELSLGIGDTVLIAQQSPTAAGGAIHSATLEAI